MQQCEHRCVEMRLPELRVVPIVPRRLRDQIRAAPVRLRDGKASRRRAREHRAIERWPVVKVARAPSQRAAQTSPGAESSSYFSLREVTDVGAGEARAGRGARCAAHPQQQGRGVIKRYYLYTDVGNMCTPPNEASLSARTAARRAPSPRTARGPAPVSHRRPSP